MRLSQSAAPLKIVVSGARGASNYDLWRAAGNVGSYADYLSFSRGDRGDPGPIGGGLAQAFTGIARIFTAIAFYNNSKTPANLATYEIATDTDPADDTRVWQVTLTAGAAGARSLTAASTPKISGAGTTDWPCVIRFASGRYQFNLVDAVTGSTVITLLDPLDESAVGAVLAPLWREANGLHITRLATRALAWFAVRYPAKYALARDWLYQMSQFGPATYGFDRLWAKNAALVTQGASNDGALVSGLFLGPSQEEQVLSDSRVMHISRPAGSYSPAGARGFAAHLFAAGQGVLSTVEVLGRRGFVELTVACTADDGHGSAAEGSVDVTFTGIMADGTRKALSATAVGRQARTLRCDFDGFAKIETAVTSTSAAHFRCFGEEYRVYLSDVPAVPVLPRTGVILCIGDSWFAYYDGLFAVALQAELDAAGAECQVVNFSTRGWTTPALLSWLPAKLAETGAICVVTDLLLNDFNSFSNGGIGLGTFTAPDGSTPSLNVASEAAYHANFNAAQAMCEAAGAYLVHVVPPGASTDGVTEGLLNVQANMRIGHCALPAPQVTAAERDDATSFHNKYGKFAGRQVMVSTTPYYASGPAAADPFQNPMVAQLNLGLPLWINMKTYRIGTYTGPPLTDANSDGYADELSPYVAGSGTTGTIDGAYQKVTTVGGGTDQDVRIGRSISVTAGHSVFWLVEIAGGTLGGSASALPYQVYQSIGYPAVGTQFYSGNLAADGSKTVYGRVAAGTGPQGAYAQITAYSAGTREWKAKITYFDLTAAQAATGVDFGAMTDAEVLAFVTASLAAH